MFQWGGNLPTKGHVVGFSHTRLQYFHCGFLSPKSELVIGLLAEEKHMPVLTEKAGCGGS